MSDLKSTRASRDLPEGAANRRAAKHERDVVHRPTGERRKQRREHVHGDAREREPEIDSITVCAQAASGNVAPIRTITGTNTGLAGADYDAVDADGNLYVTNYGSSTVPSSVTIYGPNANGNVTPIRVISGSNTGLRNPRGIAVGSDGTIYVANTVRIRSRSTGRTRAGTSRRS